MAIDTLADLQRQMDKFADGLRRRGITRFYRQYFVDARYLNQQWETENELDTANFKDPTTLEMLVEKFHEVHERLYGVKEEGGMLECLHWKGRLSARLDKPKPQSSGVAHGIAREAVRMIYAYFGTHGRLETPIYLSLIHI